MFDEFFSTAQELRAQGRPFATATVVRAEKPTSGKPGDKAIITLDGVMHGWIGGSCTQPTVVREAVKAIADDRSRLIRLSPDPEKETPEKGVEVLPMTCYSGGTLDVYIEPQQPQARLLIVGNLPVAQALAHLGKAMSYRVIAIDPEGGAAMTHADKVETRLEVLAEHITPLTYVVVATHGTHDEPALDAALRAGAGYVGLIASPKRAEAVRKYLRLTGLKERQLAALKAPAGLDIGARRGDEIALSVMAEIVQRRRSAERLTWPKEEVEAQGETPATATDPICGMAVVMEGAAHTFDHGGRTYYFCCSGCLQRFAASPESFLATAAP
ncbi:MAG: XdhC family protein [Acidobacteria bacterium]|nr:XdhC family protein [Acidobacteriota bacterium]